MEIKGFHIISNGDPSVGIFKSSWILENGFYFDNKEQLEDFRKELTNLFRNYVADDVYVETFEEHDEWIRKENEMLDRQTHE